MTYATILLDNDHTLVDSDTSEIEAFNLAMQNQGIPDPAAHFNTYREINLNLWHRVELGEMRPDDVRELRFEMLLERLGVSGDTAEMADDFIYGFATFGDLYPGTWEVLEQLSSQVTLGLLSNGLSEVQRPRIERLGVGHFFTAIVISSEVGTTKPGTEIFDIIFEQLGNPPKGTALMVGDSLTSDIKGGANYGIDTCWFNPTGKQAGPDDQITHEIKSLSELLTLV